ncbi:unnamed protein product, partial [Caenorhabditis auriculariae]
YHLSAVMGINDHLWRQRHKWRLTNGRSSLAPGKATRITRPQKKLNTFNKTAPVLRPSVTRLRYRGLPLPTRGDQISEQQDTIETDYGRATVTVYVSNPQLPPRLASDAAKEQLLAANRNALIDIVALQETKSQDTSCKTWPNGELLILGHKVPGKNVGGVGFLVNRSVQHLVDSHEIVNARLGILRLNLGKTRKTHHHQRLLADLTRSRI